MLCASCGKEISDSDRVCPHCGHQNVRTDTQGSVGNDTAVENNARKKSKAPIIAIVIICVSLVGFFGAKEFMRMSKYNSAIEIYEAGKYLEAKELFLTLSNYKESETYVTECVYQRAIQDIQNKKFDQAIKALSDLGNYKDSIKRRDEAILARKYAKFNLNVDIGEEIFEEVGVKTPEELESLLSDLVYGEWYDMETGKKIVAEYAQIDNRDYGVNYATCIDGWISVYYYYLGKPNKQYVLSNYFEFFDYIGEYVDTLSISETDTDTGYEYCSVTLDEYKRLVALNVEAEAKQRPAYSDSEIIQKAFSTFKSKIRGNYSGAGVLYHTADYSDAHVTYDWTTKTYVCTFEGEYSTNVFDFWGTSTQTYFVRAEYMDTGSGLTTLDFSVE